MSFSALARWLGCVAVAVWTAGAASAQGYPTKPIRIVTTAPGSGNDLVVRLVGPHLTASWGEPVIVDNRGILAGEIVARAPPDAYTLLAYGSPFWISPLIRSHSPYDPVRDFSPVMLTVNTPNILVVHPALPAKSVRELIAVAKSRPGELNYGSASTGSTSHLAAELFKAMAGISIVRIPYRGSGPALNALLAGEFQLMFPNAGAVAPHAKAGRLRALAVTSSEPSALAPGLPTLAASGLPGYESSSPFGMFAPAGTPPARIERLHRELVRALNRADVKERLFNAGVEVVGGSPERLAATMKSEMARWGKVIRDAGIRE